jgi:hypothetical protein
MVSCTLGRVSHVLPLDMAHVNRIRSCVSKLFHVFLIIMVVMKMKTKIAPETRSLNSSRAKEIYKLLISTCKL